MRTLPAEMTAELSKDFFCVRHLFVMEWSTTWRWTDNSRNVYYSGHWYDSKKIKFDDVLLSSTPKVDSITLDIDDVDRSITKIILSEDIKDKRARIYTLPLDRSMQPLGVAALVFLGYCDAANRPIGSKEFSIEIYNEMIKWKRMTPRRVCSPTCQWDFKHGPDKVIATDDSTVTCTLDHVAHPTNKPKTGANWNTYWTVAGSGGKEWVEGDWNLQGTCRYSGAETWCDRSWERCEALGNTINFEGERWLPRLQGKKIWWGSSADPVQRLYK